MGTMMFPVNHGAKTQRLAAELTTANEGLKTEITERKRADEALAYQAHLVEDINDAIIASDERFVTTSWNRAAEEVFRRLAS